MKNRFAFLIFLVLLFSFLSPYAYAAQIKLAWEAPTTMTDGSPLTETDLAGYRIYYGAAPGVYEQPIDIPLADVTIDNGVRTYTLPDLIEGQTYYIAVTACTTFTSSDESDYSNEVIGGIFVVTVFPPGLEFVVDSVTYTALQTFGWEVGSLHSLSLTSPQPGEIEGTQYAYWLWNDEGDQNHTITASSETPAYIAFFTAQYSLTTYVNPIGAGMISPSGTNWYDDGQSVTLSATANAGYTFSGWSGDAEGSIGSIGITMDANKTVIANFTAVPGTDPPPGPVNGLYTVTTSPSGLQITVDGTNYTAPQIFNWSSGSTHTVSVSSPQSGASGTRYVFSSWSDGGAQDHTITAPSVSTTYTANFTNQYSLTIAVSPSGGGTISPPGTNWYNTGQSVSILATAGSGYAFSAWAGDLSGTTNPVSLAMNGPKNITGNFVSGITTFSYTVAASPTGLQITVDGTNYTASQTFNWSSGSTHTVSVSSPQSGAPGARYVFSSWSDGGSQEHTITAPSASTTYTANFTTQHSLTTAVSPSGGGTASPPGTNWYNGAQSVSISATAGSGYTFSGWSGDLTGSTNPASLTMSSLISITAQFTAVPETISTPAAPSGPSNGNAGTSYSYIASGASSNLGHSLEYQYDWKGDGIDLSMWGAANQQKAWLVAGQYNVRVRARCSVHSSVFSNWSIGIPVNIQADLQISCPDNGIQCLGRKDGGHDGDNLANGKPKVDLEYEFKVVVQDKGGNPQYIKLFMTQRNDPHEADFYSYDMSCTGDYLTGAKCTYRTKLGPAAAHKFYFKAQTSAGATVTYPDNGYITGPQIHLMRGYNLVGIPRDIHNAPLDGHQALGNSEAYRWHPDGEYYTEVTTLQPVMAGEGYLVYADTVSLNELPDFEEVQAPEYSYPLKAGLNCVSNPYSGNVRLSQVKVQKGTQTPVSWQEAANNGWVVDALYYYNGKDWGDTYSSMKAEGGAALVPWLGY